MDNVTKLYSKDAAKDPDNVIEQALGEYESVFMVGYDKDGRLAARASTNISQSDILWLIESFKHDMLSGEYSD